MNHILTGADEPVFPWQPKTINITLLLLFSLCKAPSLTSNSLSAWVYLMAPWVILVHEALYFFLHAGNTMAYSNYLTKLNSSIKLESKNIKQPPSLTLAIGFMVPSPPQRANKKWDMPAAGKGFLTLLPCKKESFGPVRLHYKRIRHE